MKKISRRRRAQLNKYRMTALFLIVIFVLITIVNILMPDRVYAGKEFRDLAQKPAISVQAVKDGTFMEDMETYLSDQFHGHNKLTNLRARVSLFLGIRESNGVYKGKKGYLLEEIKATDSEVLDPTITAMQEFEKDHPTVPMYVALVPNAATILGDKLPTNMRVRDQKKQFEEITSKLSSDYSVIDLTETMLAHRDEAVYYHTDDHWTSLGAYYAYDEIKEQMGLDEDLAIAYNAYPVSNNFAGSLSGLSGYERSYKDVISIYNAANEGSAIDVVVQRDGVEKDVASLYDMDKLKTANQYNLFLGGDYPKVSIRTTASSSDRLLIVKNSYANCLVPFLTSFYREIVMVDPDYYEENVNALMEKTKFSAVLFLYDGNSFVTNTTLAGVLGDND